MLEVEHVIARPLTETVSLQCRGSGAVCRCSEETVKTPRKVVIRETGGDKTSPSKSSFHFWAESAGEMGQKEEVYSGDETT